jgi:hypothetical protein
MIDLTQEGNADRRYNRLFSPARAAGAPKGKEAEAAKLWEIESTASPYFRRWFGNSKVVDADGQPKVVYHGRLSQFEAFDNAKTNPESDVGPAHYFSDERVDSEANYASLYGPDWKVKLEARADELVFDAPEEIRGDMDAQYAWAKKKAIEELVGTEQPEGNVIETYLKIEKPVVVSDDPKTSTRWDMTDKTGLALWNAVLKASRKLGLQGTRVWDGVTAPLHRPNRTKGRDDFGIGLENGEDVTAQQLLNRLAHTDDVYDVDGGPGRVFQEIMRELGHDGVIIESAGTRYAGMEYTDGATHYAVFEPEQVKSSDNRGTFNPKDPRFRFSPEREQNRVPRRGFGGVRAARDTGGPVKPAIEWPEEVTDADRKASLKEFQAKRKQATPAGDAGLQMDKSGADGFSKAWILPDGTPQLLGGKWHHEWVQENADQFGLTERDSKPGDEGLREALVRKGGVRVNLSSSGAFTIEARKADWNRQKDAVRDLIEANLSRIGTLQVHLLNDKASRAVDADSVALFNMRSAPEKLAAIPFIDGVDKVDAGAAAAVEGRDPSPYRQAQAFPDAPVFSPRRLTHVDLPTELEKARKGEIEGQSFNPDGSIWNPRNRRVDMVTLASVNLPQSQLTKESVLRALGKNSELLGQKGIVLGFGKLGSKRLRNPEGVYEPAWSVDLNSAVPQSLRENTVAFAKANGQREIWDAKTGEAIPTGGSGDTVLSDPRDLLKAHSLLQNGEAAEVSDIPILREREELVSGDQGGFGFMAELEVRDPRHPNNMTRSEVSKAYPEVYLPPNRAQKVDIAGFDESPLYKAAKNEAEAVKQLGEKLVAEYKAKESIPEVQDGAKWYSRFVPLLKKHFGEHSGLMAELLAATSPRNNPTVNFDYAVQALWKYQDGHYDSLIEKYLEGVRGLEDGSTQAIYEADLAAGQVANPAATPGPATYMGHLIEKYNLKPTKANDKLFGATSDAVMQVLARTWLTHNRGPKVSNFVQNLLGVGHRATVDVWAGRTIRRMSHEGYVDKWRVLPANDAGISDRNFDLGQQAFDYAANKLGIEADALQGALWFAEKKHWADKGWQRLNLGDYATELKKLPELRRKYEGGEDPARPNLGLTIVPR